MVVDDSSTTPQQRPCNNFVIKKQTCLEEKTQILLTNCNRSTGRKTQQTVPKVLPQIFFIQTEEEKEIKDKTNTRPETPIENEYEIIDGTQL